MYSVIITVLLIISIFFLVYTRTKSKETFTKQNRKVLIIGSFFYHLECIGFLCENFKNFDITICIENDKFDYIKYYKNIYKINHVRNPKNLNYNSYKYIIKLTSNDPVIDTKDSKIVTKYNKKLISIVHDYESKDLVNNCIILCPYFTFRNTNSQYIFPIYNGITDSKSKKNYILYLGDYTQEENDTDLVLFNNNIKHKYKLVVCGYGNGVNRFGFNSTEYLTNNGIEYIQSISMPRLLEFLKETKYILARKWPLYKDRMSGSIPVSISHDVPLIINKDIAMDYNIQSISVTFNKNYSETTPIILNDVDYETRLEKLQNYKKRIIEENKHKTSQLRKNMQ